MNEAAMFQGASTRDLTGLVPADPSNPPVSAYPLFRITGNDPTAQQLVVLRQAAASVRAVRIGAFAGALTAWKEDDVPAVFRAANKLMAPDAAVPTFNINRSGLSRFMNLTVLKRTSMVRHQLTSTQLGTTPADHDNVPVMMQKAHDWAVANGFEAGFPTFEHVIKGVDHNKRTEVEIITATHAEVVTSQVKAPATWNFSDVDINPERIGGFLSPAYLVGLWTVVGRSPSPTVVLADEDKNLNQYSGAAGPFLSAPLPTVRTTVNTSTRGDGNIFHIAAAEFEGRLHALHYDNFLNHSSRPAANAAAGWDSQVVDGDGIAGHVNGYTGFESALVNRPAPTGAELHAFYFAHVGTTKILRHAEFDRTTGSWTTETLDGTAMDSAGAVQSDLDDGLCAVAEPDGRLHVFYHDVMKENLRHAEISVDGAWAFTVLDGSGGLIPPPGTKGTGPIYGKVGGHPAAVLFDGGLYVFYDDSVNRNIRMAVRRKDAGEEVWRYHVLDGSNWAPGTVSSEVSGSSAVVWNDRMSVLYADWTQKNLRHAYLVQGAPKWHFETLDGAGGSAGRVDDEVGGNPTAFAAGVANGAPSLPLAVAYMNAHTQKLRWAVLDEAVLV